VVVSGRLPGPAWPGRGGGRWDLGAVGGLWRLPRFDGPADMAGWLGSDWGKCSAALCGSCMPAVPASLGRYYDDYDRICHA
jgi:hypothetical protein